MTPERLAEIKDRLKEGLALPNWWGHQLLFYIDNLQTENAALRKVAEAAEFYNDHVAIDLQGGKSVAIEEAIRAWKEGTKPKKEKL